MDAFAPLETPPSGASAAFAPLRDAQSRSTKEMARLIAGCATVELPPETAMVVSGSLARREFTMGSDLDYMLVDTTHGRTASDERWTKALEAVDEVVVGLGYPPPSRTGAFGGFVRLAELRHVGGESDGNEPLTRRMSLLLESAEVGASGLRDRCVADVIDHYLQEAPGKDRQPPRFLLNDIVRYWRTMCVDYEGKLRRATDEKWALRNAKLRTSRKMLFAGGLFPVLECKDKQFDEMKDFLIERFAMTPAERVAAAATSRDDREAATRALAAYGRWLELINDADRRKDLETLAFDEREESETHQAVKGIGRDFHGGLRDLLFRSDRYRAVAEDYLVF